MTIVEKFNKAFNDLLAAGDNLIKVNNKLNYAKELITINKVKQKQLQKLLEVAND